MVSRFLTYLLAWNRAKERARADREEHARIVWPKRSCGDPRCEWCER